MLNYQRVDTHIFCWKSIHDLSASPWLGGKRLSSPGGVRQYLASKELPLRGAVGDDLLEFLGIFLGHALEIH